MNNICIFFHAKMFAFSYIFDKKKEVSQPPWVNLKQNVFSLHAICDTGKKYWYILKIRYYYCVLWMIFVKWEGGKIAVDASVGTIKEKYKIHFGTITSS